MVTALLRGTSIVVISCCAFFYIPVGNASQTSVITGAEFTSGDYGGDKDIKDVYIPVTIRYEETRYSVRLTIPYRWVNAPEGTFTDPGGAVLPGTGNNSTETGIGDVVAGGSLYDVWKVPQRNFAMDISGKVKFGTGDEDKGLSTGENDYGIYANFYHWIDRTSLIAVAGYLVRGDPPGVDLDNSASVSLGVAHRLNSSTRVSGYIDWRQSSFPGDDDPTELTAFISHQLTSSYRLTSYALAGLSDSSPDWGVGFMIEWRGQ